MMIAEGFDRFSFVERCFFEISLCPYMFHTRIFVEEMLSIITVDQVPVWGEIRNIRSSELQRDE